LPNQHPARAAAARTALFIALALQLGAGIHPGAALAAEPRVDSRQDAERLAPRQRIRLDEGWRFRLGDPDGQSAAYLYDIRPEVAQSADGKVADAMPEEAARVAKAGAAVLKPWILPSGNAFVLDPARRHVRPALEPAFDAPFAQPGFDDAGWRAVRLPHDWAIEGTFLASGPYGGMGRLKTWGAAWYRNKLDIPAADRGKRVFLDVDGAMSYASVWINGRLAGGWPYGYNSWPHRPDAVRELRRRQPAGDPPRQSARIGALVSGRGPVPRRLADQDRAAARGPVGHACATPEVSEQSARVDVGSPVDNDGGAAAAACRSAPSCMRSTTPAAPAARRWPRWPRRPPRWRRAQQRHGVGLGDARQAAPVGPAAAQKPQRYVAVVTVRSRTAAWWTATRPRSASATVRFDPAPASW
jgi:beta-galactosidase